MARRPTNVHLGRSIHLNARMTERQPAEAIRVGALREALAFRTLDRSI